MVHSFIDSFVQQVFMSTSSVPGPAPSAGGADSYPVLRKLILQHKTDNKETKEKMHPVPASVEF